MRYFLDTDICIYALKNQFPSIKKWLLDLSPDQIKVPSIVQAELLLGALKSAHSKQFMHIIEKFLAPYEIIPFGGQEAIAYAGIRQDLEKKGVVIGPNDLIIAATVLSNQGTLVTHNTKEFTRVQGLLIQDWCK